MEGLWPGASDWVCDPPPIEVKVDVDAKYLDESPASSISEEPRPSVVENTLWWKPQARGWFDCVGLAHTNV